MTILLTFPNKNESENSYKAVIGFFGKSKVVIKIKKHTEGLKLFIADDNGKFVHTGIVEYNEDNFNNWIANADRGFRISLFMIYKNYKTRTFIGIPVLTPIISQQHNRLTITSFEIIT